MTKFTALLLALLLLCTGLTGCASESWEENGIQVTATNFALYDFARAVCGDLAEVTMLISPGSESHDFEASLADIAAIAGSELFLSVGSEDWVDDIFTAIGEEGADVNRLTAMEYCEVYGASCELPGHEDHEHVHEEDGHDHDHDGEELDEHVWTSISNALILLDEIAERMCGIDPENAPVYLAQKDTYAVQLRALDAEFREMTEHAERRTIVVADRFPFLYLADDYGLTWHAAFSGCSSDTEPSLATINTLIETVKHEEIPAVFIIEFSDGRTAGAVAFETGCDILTIQSAHNVTRKEFLDGVTYLDLMRDNLDALRTALN